MIFTSDKFADAMNNLMGYAVTLLPVAVNSELEKQRIEYNENITRIASAADTSLGIAISQTGEFVPDREDAQRMAKMAIDVGIGNRIRGAIACYEAGNEAECARLLVLAQATLLSIIGMNTGASVLDDAAGYMYKQQKTKLAA